MELFILISFTISSLLILILISYPLISYMRMKGVKHETLKDLSFQPPVSIIISCYNEEKYIFDRISSILHTSEWIAGSELIVVSTGSTDNTNEILKSFESNPNVQIFYREKITKIEALNWAFGISKNDYLVFSDCRQLMKPGSIKQLIANLKDPNIGTVTCTILDTLEKPSFFRRLFLFIAVCDSKASSTFNLYGALYAQRRDVFRQIPINILFDDFFVAVSTLSQNKRLVQERNAVLYDVPFIKYYNRERIERLARGLLIFLFNNFSLIKSIPIKTRIRFYIYKYLKLMMPVVLSIWFIAAISLSVENIPTVYLFISIVLFLLSILLVPKMRIYLLTLFRINFYFMNAMIGFFIFNRRSIHWQPLKIRRQKMDSI